MKQTRQKKSKIPKDSLIVDYGDRRVVMPYRHPIDLYNNQKLDIIRQWCHETLPRDSWCIHMRDYPDYIYFLKDSYLTLFILRWL